MRISEDHIYFVVLVATIVVILGIIIYVLLNKSKSKLVMGTSLKSDQDLFMKLHSEMLTTNASAYGRK